MRAHDRFLERHRRYVLGALLIVMAALVTFVGLQIYYTDQITEKTEHAVDIGASTISVSLQGYINTLSLLADAVRAAGADDGRLDDYERAELVRVTKHVLERDPVVMCGWVWLEPGQEHGDGASRQNPNYPDDGRFFVSFVRKPDGSVVRTYDLVRSNDELAVPDGLSFYREALLRKDLWIDVDTAGYSYGGVLATPVMLVTLSYPVVGTLLPHRACGVVGLDFAMTRFLFPGAVVDIPHNFVVLKKDGTLVCVTSSGFGSLGANINDPTRIWQDDLRALASVLRQRTQEKLTRRVGTRWVRIVPVHYTTPYAKNADYVLVGVVADTAYMDRVSTLQALHTTSLAMFVVLCLWTYIYARIDA